MKPRILPGPPAQFRLAIDVICFLCETTTRVQALSLIAVSVAAKRPSSEACYFCRRVMERNLLFARIVPRIDIVELQGCVSVNLNNDLARCHRVMVHVRIEIGKAAGGE